MREGFSKHTQFECVGCSKNTTQLRVTYKFQLGEAVSGLKPADSAGFMRGLKPRLIPPPPSELSCWAACDGPSPSVRTSCSQHETSDGSLALPVPPARHAKLRAGKQDQAGGIGPKEQADGDMEPTVEVLQVQMWQKSHEDIFRYQPHNAGNHGGPHHRTPRNLAIG